MCCRLAELLGARAEETSRPWGFPSVAEANLFGIMGITGAADTEASKDGGRREGGRAAGADRDLIVLRL